MKRKDFLKGLGVAGVSSLVPVSVIKAGNQRVESSPLNDCVLIPSETAGPFPLDLTENTEFFRQDVREDREGVQLNLKMKILGANNCGPMQNVRVNIWHCDKDGRYSGYSQNNNPGQAGLTYLRGYQFTDANGEVEFVTIFPGWYQGRICHIHFQVYVSSSYAAISQLTFDIDTKNAIYSANSSLYTKGADPTSLSGDNIFSDGYQYQMASLSENSETDGYNAYMEVTVQGEGTVGIGHIEKETRKQFTMEQNYPNPFGQTTTIPFNLNYSSDVQLEIWDLTGKKVATLNKGRLSAGSHTVELNMQSLRLGRSTYVYQLLVTNANGVWKQCKTMTSYA